MSGTSNKRDEARRPRTTGRGANAAARRLYFDLFTPDERAALADAAEDNDLHQELALLRMLIRRGVAEGVDLETISRAMGRLAQMMRVQHVIRGQAVKNLDDALAKALEEIANEMGM